MGADLNFDFLPEIILVGESDSHFSAIYENNGDGTFTKL